MAVDTVQYYRAFLDAQPGLAEASCLTCATGCDDNTFITALRGNPNETRSATLAEAFAWSGSTSHTQVGDFALIAQQGDWLFALEPNGYQGSSPVSLRNVSMHGRALSVFWNVNAHNAFSYFSAGQHLVTLDMLSPNQRHGHQPDVLERNIATLPFGDDTDWKAAGLALAEHITGQRRGHEWTTQRCRLVIPSPAAESHIPAGWEGNPALDDPELQGIITSPTPAMVPHMLAILATLVTRNSDIPPTQEILDIPATVRQRQFDKDLSQRLAKQAEQTYSQSITHQHTNPDLSRDLFRKHHAYLSLSHIALGDFRQAKVWANYVITQPPDRLKFVVLRQSHRRATQQHPTD